MTTKTILAIFGDTHIGSSTALAPPSFTIHNQDPKERQPVSYNRLQKWLWECWTDYWDYIDYLARDGGRKRKHRIIAVHLGDIIDGNHHGTLQIIQDVGDQSIVAIDVMQPIRDKADKFFGVVGTSAHGGNSGSNEIAIYKDLGVDDYDQSLMLEIDGKVHDFKHQGLIVIINA